MLFETDLDRLDFLKLLRFTIVAFNWRCLAYCLMGTHYHLIVETTREQLSNGMRKLNGDYARRFNSGTGPRPSLRGAFRLLVLDDEQHLHAAVAYFHRNPVRARLCDRAADWPWSG